MENMSRLRRHIGESARLIDVDSKAHRTLHLLDFTGSRGGDEITLIEVGGHGVTVEYAASGHKSIFAFNDIQIQDRASGKKRTAGKSLHGSGKNA